MNTSELFEDITSIVLLGPSAEYELKRILRRLDGKTIVDDLVDDEEEEDD